eukprot:gene27790-5741_t
MDTITTTVTSTAASGVTTTVTTTEATPSTVAVAAPAAAAVVATEILKDGIAINSSHQGLVNSGVNMTSHYMAMTPEFESVHHNLQFEVCVEFEGGTEEWLAGTTCIMRFGYGQHKTFLTGLKATHQLERLYAPHVRRADCPQCMANASSSGGNDAGGGGVGGVGDSGGSGGREQSFATTFEMRNAHSILGQDLA